MQQSVQHQMMGYDRASIVFSPDGRLLQVEYAKKAVEQGTLALGMVCRDGVVLIADKRLVDKFIVPKSVEKVFQVDDHIAATATGYLMDGRVLIERAQLMAQQHKVTYDNPIETVELVKEISDLKQMYTQFGGARPYGVSILFAGIDEEGPKLFETEPTGIYFGYLAAAIGESEAEAEDILRKEYNQEMPVEDGARLGIKILKKVLARDFAVERVDGCILRTPKRKFERLTPEQVEKISKTIK